MYKFNSKIGKLLGVAGLIASGWSLSSRSDNDARCVSTCNGGRPKDELLLATTTENSTKIDNLKPVPTSLSQTFRLPTQTEVKKDSDWVSKLTTEFTNILTRTAVKKGIPGIAVTLSVNGCIIFSNGVGFADLENSVPCSSQSVMRIASISKPLTATALMQLWEKGKIDLDAPIQSYLPDYPSKTFQGEPVTITTRQLLSHMAGIRTYHETGGLGYPKEYYVKEHYNDISSSLQLFSEDDLIAKPGTTYHYTTYGYTILSALIETISGERFLSYMKKNIFEPLGMDATWPELHLPLIMNRSRHYERTETGELSNTPYVDNSYKWGGGGFMSTTEDLVKFGNAMLISYNNYEKWNKNKDKVCVNNDLNKIKEESRSDDILSSHFNFLLLPSTVKQMWDIAVRTEPEQSRCGQTGYGMGWNITEEKERVVGGRSLPRIISHTGGAVGASSVLVIIPGPVNHIPCYHDNQPLLNGIVICVLCNAQKVPDIGIFGIKLALKAYELMYEMK